MAEDPPPAVNQLREEAGLAPLTPERETATQDMVDLTQELGLYDMPAEEYVSAMEQAGYSVPVTENCPFCGAEKPCPSHRAGG